MGKGKGKGSDFERQICKELGLWWTNNERDDIFWRSSNSGGRATVRSRQDKGTFGQYGDVQATDPIGQPLIDLCTIELKRGYGNASVGDVIDKGPKAAEQMWETWVRQAKEDHEKAGSFSWLLITKRDRRSSMVFLPLKLWRRLFQTNTTLARSRPLTRLFLPGNRRIYGTLFSQFISRVSRDNILGALKGEKNGERGKPA